jgi:hypothetical protein
MAALPGTHTFTARVGDVFYRKLRYEDLNGTPIDLTGWSASFIARRSRRGAVIVALSDGEGITLGGSAGTIEMYIPATATDAWQSVTGEYDLNLVPASGDEDAFTLLSGTFTVQHRTEPKGGNNGQ